MTPADLTHIEQSLPEGIVLRGVVIENQATGETQLIRDPAMTRENLKDLKIAVDMQHFDWREL